MESEMYYLLPGEKEIINLDSEIGYKYNINFTLYL